VSLEVQHDVLGIIRWQERERRIHQDVNNWLKQESQDGDPFIDDVRRGRP
jgi:hypothetical protein